MLLPRLTVEAAFLVGLLLAVVLALAIAALVGILPRRRGR